MADMTIAQDSAIARVTAPWVAYMDVRHETAILPFCDSERSCPVSLSHFAKNGQPLSRPLPFF